MHTRIWSQDPASGITKLWHYDPDTDQAIIETRQDVEPLIEANKRMRREQWERRSPGKKFDPKKFMHLKMRLPLFIFFDLKKRGILGGTIAEPLVLDEKEFAKWMNNSDNSVWSVHEGKV